MKNLKSNKGKGCIVAIIGIFIILAVIVAIGANNGEISLNNTSELITLSEFNQIQNGMTYEEVKNIIGSDGTLTAESGTEPYKIEIYSWYGNKISGANANFTFTNGELTGKAQVGLTD